MRVCVSKFLTSCERFRGKSSGSGVPLDSRVYISMLDDAVDTESVATSYAREQGGRRSSVTSSTGARRRASLTGDGLNRPRAPIRLVHAFGTHSQTDDALLLDDDTVLHRTGRWLVSQPIVNSSAVARVSFFYELESNVTRLNAVCISENHKYIALCEQLEAPASGLPPSPQVRVVNAQARRTICVLSGALEGAFIGCTFSSDCKHVLAYTGEPDHVTVVWQFIEERPVGMHKSKTPLSRVLFNPWMGSLISLSAPLRLARLNDQGHFKEIEVTALKRYGTGCIDHAWLAAKSLVFIDEASGLRILEDSVLRQTIEAKEGSPQPKTLTALSRGFAAGTSDGDVRVQMPSRTSSPVPSHHSCRLIHMPALPCACPFACAGPDLLSQQGGRGGHWGLCARLLAARCPRTRARPIHPCHGQGQIGPGAAGRGLLSEAP